PTSRASTPAAAIAACARCRREAVASAAAEEVSVIAAMIATACDSPGAGRGGDAPSDLELQGLRHHGEDGGRAAQPDAVGLDRQRLRRLDRDRRGLVLHDARVRQVLAAVDALRVEEQLAAL